jgi:negative regulator of replication initiation
MLELRREDPTGNKPTGFGLFGTEYKVDTWRDMLLTTLSVLAELYGDEFASKAVNVKTSKRAHIAYEPEGMITPMQIPGTSLWVEANQSSRSVLWVIRQTMDACGVPEDEFEAYW